MKALALIVLGLFCSALCLPAQTATGVEGKWAFVLDTPGGDRPADAEFHLDGEKVTGKWGKAEVQGTFAEGKLELAFTIETEEAGTGTLKLSGKLENDELTGTWTFTEYTGTFKATRPK